mgnify:CR=1 FL=1
MMSCDMSRGRGSFPFTIRWVIYCESDSVRYTSSSIVCKIHFCWVILDQWYNLYRASTQLVHWYILVVVYCCVRPGTGYCVKTKANIILLWSAKSKYCIVNHEENVKTFPQKSGPSCFVPKPWQMGFVCTINFHDCSPLKQAWLLIPR